MSRRTEEVLLYHVLGPPQGTREGAQTCSDPLCSPTSDPCPLPQPYPLSRELVFRPSS